MRTAVPMLWMLCLLPGSLAQNPASSSFLPKSLIPDIFPLPVGDLQNDLPFEDTASFPNRPSNPFSRPYHTQYPNKPQPQPPRAPVPPNDLPFEDTAPFPYRPSNPFSRPYHTQYPNKPQPQPPRAPVPQQPLYLSPYKNRPSSEVSQFTPSNVYPVPPNQYQSGSSPNQSPSVYHQMVTSPNASDKKGGHGSKTEGIPPGILGLYYHFDRMLKGLGPVDYYGVSPRFYQNTQMKKTKARSKPRCKGFLEQRVCKTCPANKPCYFSCC